MRIYVSVGTHEQPFQRLLDSVASAVSSMDHEWIVQYGVGTWGLLSPVVRASAYLSADEVKDALGWADVMISQASPGNSFGALDAEVWPIVLGRQKSHGEHVDDHQVRFAAALADMGLATDMQSESRLPEVLSEVALRAPGSRKSAIRAAMAESSARRAIFRDEAWTLILANGMR
jgi:UDP-N-acetylglucosamine transferase subunit ALG13